MFVNVARLSMSFLLLMVVMSSFAYAKDSDKSVRLPEVVVVGTSPEDIETIPGSADIISKEELNRSKPVNVNEALRKVSGIYVRDEDGLGLRPNISLRGVFEERSRKVLMMEDGVPISLAPYGENSAYYVPVIERIDRIEVLKGSGSILYGPQTVGGVINFVTDKPYETPGFGAGVTYGSNNFALLQFRTGGTWNGTGLDFTVNHKQGDGPRDPMPFRIWDVSTKLTTELTENSDLSFKFHYYNEDSKSTYRGLTRTMYNQDPNQNPAENDVFLVERADFSVNHEYRGWEDLTLNTTAYTYFTRRDWWREDFHTTSQNATYDRISGPGTDRDSIFWRDTNGGRNRDYRVVGIAPRLEGKNFKAGLKAHFEVENNKRIDGATADARSGVLDDHEYRRTWAFAGYGLYDWNVTEKLSVKPGMRVEFYNQEREILLVDQVHKDIQEDTGFKTELIPGVGATYDVNDNVNVFGGVHRGFAPPRFSSAIDKSANDQKLDAELSWNYELGVRSQVTSWLDASLTGFIIDYQNQVVDASPTTGRDKANGGETGHSGFEVDLGTTFELSESFTLRSNFNYAYINAQFGSYDEEVKQNGQTVFVSRSGNRLPYQPEVLSSLSFDLGHKSGWNVFLEGVFVGSMFTDAANTEASNPEGTEGSLDSHTIWNATVSYSPTEKKRYFVAMKNLFNETYIASRKASGTAQGIHPGPEFQLNVGVTYNL